MKNNRRIIVSIVWIVLGIGLNVACFVTELDTFWSGMATALIFVGVFGLFRWYKYYRNAEYREKMDVETNDERNRYLSARAWAWTGYIFVIISAVACIVFKILGNDLLSFASSGAVCLILIIYTISFFILKRKY